MKYGKYPTSPKFPETEQKLSMLFHLNKFKQAKTILGLCGKNRLNYLLQSTKCIFMGTSLISRTFKISRKFAKIDAVT